MATLLKADGTEMPITDSLTLETMQRLVGGDVEFVTLGYTPSGHDLLIVNENGLGRLPINDAATAMFYAANEFAMGPLVGDVIKCTCIDMGHESERYE